MAITNKWYPSKGRGVAVAMESTFGTASTAEGDYRVIAPKNLEFEAGCDVIDPEYSRDDMMKSPSIVGRQTPTAKFALNVRGGVAAPSAGDPSEIYKELEYPLKAALGAPVSDVTAIAESGTVTTAVVVNGDNFKVGSVVLIDPDGTGTGALYPRMIASIESNTLYWTDALGAAVESNGKIYGGVCYKAAFSIDQSMSMQLNTVKMDGSLYSVMLTGLGGKATVGADEAGKELLLNFELQGDSFAEQEAGSAIVTPVANPYPAAADRPNVLLARNATCLINGDATPVAKFSFEPGYEIAENQDQRGAQGRGIWKVTAQRPVINVTIPFAIFARTGYTAGTIFRFVYAIANAANGFAMATEAAQIAEVKESDINGVKAVDLKLECVRPEAATHVNAALPAWSMAFFGEQMPLT
ncbi:MAG: hypothetical protein C4523_19715 [Myxococcales bacterium]|nr:MAG: hypothetical protein C4523_19715 [Myxococcales bacterium]